MLPVIAAAVMLLPAHASVIGSTPSADDVLTEQPGTFSVVMNEEILTIDGADGANALQVTDAAGAFYGDGCFTVEGDTISLDAELGDAGEYEMTYQVVSADGHPVSDTIAFTFEPGEGEAGEPGAADAPVCGESGAGQEPEATDEGAAPTASADQGDGERTETDAAEPGATDEAATDDGAEAAAEDGGSFPFIAIGVLAILAVLAVIAYRANRLRRDVAPRDDDEA